MTENRAIAMISNAPFHGIPREVAHRLKDIGFHLEFPSITRTSMAARHRVAATSV